jgi:NADH:ubiquinone oxidoreductase subunit H
MILHLVTFFRKNALHILAFLVLVALPIVPFLLVRLPAHVGADFYLLVYELDSVSNLRYGLLLILAFSSLTAYSIILAG